MKVLENLKLDSWYGILLYVGVLMKAASLFFESDFLEEKHLFGLGLGFFLIGLSFWIAEGYNHTIKPPNYYTGGAALLSWKVFRHNIVTILLFMNIR